MAQVRKVIPTLLSLLLGVAAMSCRQATNPHQTAYVVTASPLNIGVGSGRFCIAIDPDNPEGVWWWEPGKDCSTRSTGPRVFEAEQARVSRAEATGKTDVSFRLAVHSTENPFVDIRLVLERGRLRATATGAEVGTVHRRDLDVPEAFQR